jgi:hypothetical protein
LNILALCNKETAIEITRQIPADSYVFITNRKVKVKGKIKAAYHHNGLKKGRYFPKINWNDIKPLPEYVIEKMAYAETETIKMLERIKRIRPSNYENRENYYFKYLRWWNHLLDKYKPDIFYRSAPPHEGYDNIIYHLCKLKGIKTLCFNPFHPRMAYFARSIRDPFPNFKIGNDEPLSKDLEWLLETHGEKIVPKSGRPVIIPKKKLKTQRTLLKRHKGLLKHYSKLCVKPDLSKPYIYFPLHFQYEATTSSMGGIFRNQLLAIDILSNLGIQIYVKEHPRMSKNRNLNYYNHIHNTKNVNLISIKANHYSLIDNSLAVSTITGTAGLEALLRLKPCLVFGYIYYMYHKNAYKITDVDTAIDAIGDIRTNKVTKEYNEQFLKALQPYLFKHTIKDIVKALKEEIESK